MILPNPTPAQERWLVLAARYRALRALAETPERTGGWKTSSWLSRCLFFVLGLVAASMILGSVMLFPARLFIAGCLMLGLAEWMIAQRRVVHSGIEEALHVCGCVTLAVQFVLAFDLEDDALAAAILVVAVSASGARLLNPLFTTVAAAGATVGVALLGHKLFASTLNAAAASLCAAGLAALALVAGARTFQRPSHDRMLDGLVVAMPATAYAWAAMASPAPPPLLGIGLALGLGLVCVLAGLRRRRHAPLVAALGCALCLVHGLRTLSGLTLTWRLILGGGLALCAAVVLERWLRTGRGGITSRDVGEDLVALELLQVGGAALATPAPAAPPPGDPGAGGGVGGGGARGRY
jgi:hypothetical protein